MSKSVFLMDILNAYQVLEVSVNATPREIRIAYFDLLAIWHPDKHENNPRRRQKATEKTQQITEAYGVIKKHLEAHKGGSSCESDFKGEEEKSRIVRCPNCGTFNRVTSDDLGSFSCGKCKGPLSFTQDFRKTERKGRQACGDGSCIGYIGENGKCIICGKTYRDAAKEDNEKSKKQYEQYKENYEEEQRKGRKKNIIKSASVVSVIVFIIFIIAIYGVNKRTNIDNIIDKVVSEKFNEEKPQYLPDKNNKILLGAQAKPWVANELKNETKYNSQTEVDKLVLSLGNLSYSDIITMQKSLKSVGYELGIADGKLGPKTKKAIDEYLKDFKVGWDSSGLPAQEDFLGALERNSQLAEKCKNWRFLNRTGKLEAWINRQPQLTSYTYRKIVESGTADAVKWLVALYDFAQEKPKWQLFPSSGILEKKFDKGVAPFTIITRGSDGYYIKLVKSDTREVVLTEFIVGGHQVKTEVPLGSYYLRYASGKDWYGTKYLFGPATSFAKAEKVFEFTSDGYRAHGYSVELYKQINGNLRTQKLSPFDF